MGLFLREPTKVVCVHACSVVGREGVSCGALLRKGPYDLGPVQDWQAAQMGGGRDPSCLCPLLMSLYHVSPPVLKVFSPQTQICMSSTNIYLARLLAECSELRCVKACAHPPGKCERGAETLLQGQGRIKYMQVSTEEERMDLGTSAEPTR